MKRGKATILMLLCSTLAAVLMMIWPVKNGIEVEAAVVNGGQLVQTRLLRGTVRYAQEQPCISLRDGLVKEVYVREGQTVKRGDLLFQLDTSSEEKALAALHEWHYQTRTALAGMDEAVYALTIQEQLEWASAEAELKANIELAAVRASSDGIMGEIYAEKGDRVAQTDLLGMVHGEGWQIVAAASPEDGFGIETGCAANAKTGNGMKTAVLVQKEQTQDGMLMLCFEPLEQAVLTECSIGEIVQLEVVSDIAHADALIPLSAFDSEGNVWSVENGLARCRQVRTERSNRQFAAVNEEWSGRTVILYPENCKLEEGMPVRVKK